MLASAGQAVPGAGAGSNCPCGGSEGNGGGGGVGELVAPSGGNVASMRGVSGSEELEPVGLGTKAAGGIRFGPANSHNTPAKASIERYGY